MKTTRTSGNRRDEQRIPELLLLPSLALVTLGCPGLCGTCGSARPWSTNKSCILFTRWCPSVKGTPSLEWYQIFLPTSLKSTMGRYPHSPGHTAFGQQEGFKGWIGSGEQKWEITQSSPSTLTVSSNTLACLLEILWTCFKALPRSLLIFQKFSQERFWFEIGYSLLDIESI